MEPFFQKNEFAPIKRESNLGYSQTLRKGEQFNEYEKIMATIQKYFNTI